ncbi:protein phosphatase 1 regulatory subunit 15B [Aquarana catesbeiana]|uniref:protein phosphatase 1 regulatory subunit 15B n=1 Tax=Aquarana catesbeiana TaxID=8400 RepID=UPI003CC97026
MFADKNDRSSPGLRALLGRFLRGLHPYRLFQRVGAAWSYLMGPWEASSFLPSGWLIHRSVRSGELPEVLEALGLRSGSWEELGESLDELGTWKEFLPPEVGVDLHLLKSWQGVSSGKDEDSTFEELTTWQKVHGNMQVFWEQGLAWNDTAEPNQEECHKTASASQNLTNEHELYKVTHEISGALPYSSSLGILSYILNVGSGEVHAGFQWKDDQIVDDPSQSPFEIQHIRDKRLRFLQQNKTQEVVTSGVKQEASDIEQSQTIVPKRPDPMHLSLADQDVSNLNVDLPVSECLEAQSKKIHDQCEWLPDLSLTQGDVPEFLEMNEMYEKYSSCDQQPVVVQEVDESSNHQHLCPSSPDKDQGYHSLEYWQCPLPQNLTTVGTPEPCELDRESVLFALPTELSTCPDDQNNEDMDSDLHNEIPISSVSVCTNKHIGFILGTVVSDDDDTSPSSSDEWDKEEDDDDDGFDSEGSISSTDSETSVPEDVLWDLFCSADPYNLQNFTASLQTGVTTGENSLSLETLDQPQYDEELWCDSNAESDSESDCSADEQENLRLWNAFLKSDDPYNPLYFTAPVQTSEKRQSSEIVNTNSEMVCTPLPNEKVTLVTHQAYDLQQLQFKETYSVEDSANLGHKKVTFHEKVTIHYVCNEERKGHWEELARDRCRFQRRIKETEFVIGHCLTPDHRQRAWERMQGQQGS